MSDLATRHMELYNEEPTVITKAPGRVNLIGEHTDYNDGYVLPTPIDRYLWVSASPRKDNKVKIHALDFNQQTEHQISSFKYDKNNLWANYVLGVIYALKKNGYSIGGVNLCVTGDVPICAGLSSSAALETSMVRAMKELNGLELGPISAAYIGKQSENEFVGIQSGIMDQFVSGLGEYGKALFIDCRTNEHKSYPLDPRVRVVIVNTMISRAVVTSEYNTRQAQCMEAVGILKEKYPEINALRDVTTEMLQENWQNLSPVVARRARHIVTENQRVLDSIEHLTKGELDEFGELFYDSHDSLKHDYEVSCKHLDALVSSTMNLDGVLGARMTGAGFGGCTVNLVDADYVDEFTETIKERYFRRTAKKCEVYLA